MNTPAVTRTEVSRIVHAPVTSTAPNGSSTGTDYRTTVVIREEWADVPENGVYAGRVYRITRNYISTDPHHIGQLAGSSSSPWADDPAEEATEDAPAGDVPPCNVGHFSGLCVPCDARRVARKPLGDVEDMYRSGRIGQVIFEAYMYLWNTSAFRYSSRGPSPAPTCPETLRAVEMIRSASQLA